MRNTRRLSRPAVVACMLMLAFAGCATMPPAKPVTSLQQIAGTWEGAGTGPGGMFSIKNYVIKADGTWEFDLPGGNPPHHTGTLQLVDGKLRSRSNTTGNSATWTLHEGDGKRMLRVVNDDGRVTADLTPVKP